MTDIPEESNSLTLVAVKMFDMVHQNTVKNYTEKKTFERTNLSPLLFKTKIKIQEEFQSID